MEDLPETPDIGIETETLLAPTTPFVGSGDSSFDSLMAEVERFKADCQDFIERVRAEVESGRAQQPQSGITPQGFVYNTGDSRLDNLLNSASQELAEYRALDDLVHQQLGEGKYLSFEDAIKRGGRQGLQDYINQTLEWLSQASPEEIRQWQHESDAWHESEMARLHHQAVLRECGEIQQQIVKGQTKEQFEAEKEGYHQVYSQSPYSYGPHGDPDIFERNGEYYRLMPGGQMVHLT